MSEQVSRVQYLIGEGKKSYSTEELTRRLEVMEEILDVFAGYIEERDSVVLRKIATPRGEEIRLVRFTPKQ